MAKSKSGGAMNLHKQIASGMSPETGRAAVKLACGGPVKRTTMGADKTSYQNYGRGVRKVKV